MDRNDQDPVGHSRLLERFKTSKAGRVLQVADFRLLWIGAFVSFTGSWVQNVAQGHFVYDLTRDESKLAFVTFCNSFPVFILGLVAGSLVDTMDRRKLLVAAQIVFSLGSLYLAAATFYGFVQYWHLPVVAAILGSVACFEMPARQSIVSKVVPPEDLASAVPIQAMTFNTARIIGPAIGGLLLSRFGVAACYLVNGLTFLVMIRNVLAIRTDLRSPKTEPQPVKDLVLEGTRFTWRDRRLRALFLLESLTAIFGIAYIPLMAAFVREELGMATEVAAKQVLANCYTSVGLGALFGLVLIANFNEPRHRPFAIRFSMGSIAAGLCALSFARTPEEAYPWLALVGMSTIMQFNTTNALFQLLSPDRLRGRVLAMHIWALNGLSPLGVMLLGWLAAETRPDRILSVFALNIQLPFGGVDATLIVGAAMMAVGTVAAILTRDGLSNLRMSEER